MKLRLLESEKNNFIRNGHSRYLVSVRIFRDSFKIYEHDNDNFLKAIEMIISWNGIVLQLT